MTSPQPDAEKLNRFGLFVAFVILNLSFLTGCGGGWQPDPREMSQSPARSGIEDSGIPGPEDSGPRL